MVNSICVDMDLRSFRINRDVGALRVDPRPGVEITHSVPLRVQGNVGVPAKDALGSGLLRVSQRAVGNFSREPQPSRIQAVEIPREALFFVAEFLDQQIEELSDATQQNVIHNEAVELMSVYREVSDPVELPRVLLIHRHAD